MAYTDYSSHWSLDTFLTYLEANTLGSNDEHLYDTFAVEHNINTATIDGTHKANSITGSSINTTPASTGSQVIISGATWTPSVGVYQVGLDSPIGSPSNFQVAFEMYISGSWRKGIKLDFSLSLYAEGFSSGIVFCDGTNMRFENLGGSSVTLWYQKF